MNVADTTLSEASFCILVALLEPLHGYGIAKKVETISDGRVLLGAGTLYGALTSMQKRGWIKPAGGTGRRKVYALTPSGRALIDQEITRLEALARLGRDTIAHEEKRHAAE